MNSIDIFILSIPDSISFIFNSGLSKLAFVVVSTNKTLLDCFAYLTISGNLGLSKGSPNPYKRIVLIGFSRYYNCPINRKSAFYSKSLLKNNIKNRITLIISKYMLLLLFLFIYQQARLYLSRQPLRARIFRMFGYIFSS